MITSAMCTWKNSQTEVRDLNDIILVNHYLSLRYSLQPKTNIDNETYSPPGYRHVRYHACASIPNHWPFVTSVPYIYIYISIAESWLVKTSGKPTQLAFCFVSETWFFMYLLMSPFSIHGRIMHGILVRVWSKPNMGSTFSCRNWYQISVERARS